MKFTVVLSVLVAGFVGASQASARGGAIGGGDVSLYPIMSCKAESMDPTFPSQAKSVVVMGEAGYDGYLLPDQVLTVGLFDANGGGLMYLPTQTLPAYFDPADLKTYQYHQSQNENYMTAIFQVTGTTGYLFSTADAMYVEELALSDCEYVVHAQ